MSIRHNPSHHRQTRRTLLLGLSGLTASVLGALPGVRPARAQVAPATPWLQLDPAKPLSRIAFGSCLQQRQPQPIWKAVREAKPELFVMTGDSVYGDVTDGTMKELKAAYQRQGGHPAFAEARAAWPFLATWDDHDYGLNDAAVNFPYKAEARALFAEFWGLDAKILPPDGIYRTQVIGPPGQRVQIILLDARSFRSEFTLRTKEERAASLLGGPYTPDLNPDKTMLGPVQWSWLESELRRPAEIRLIVSSIQLLAEAHHFERWGNLPREQARFFDLLRQTRAKGVLVLSGDRHRAQIYRRTEDVDYPLHEITSSALNVSVAGREPNDAGRLGAMLSEDNFGLIVIDWEARRLRAGLERLSGIPAPGIDLSFDDLGIARDQR